MSRHYISTNSRSGDELQIVIGYDRPLDFVSCAVHKVGEFLGVPGLLCTSSDESDWTKRSERWGRGRRIRLSRF